MRHALSRAATGFEEADFLHREVRSRLLDRFDFLRIRPGRILDLGAGTGAAVQSLGERFPAAAVLALDLVPEMLRANPRALSGESTSAVCGDAQCLPLGPACVDLVFSNLMLHWARDVNQVLAEVRRVLRPEGLFIFATLGAGTLSELHQAWQKADRFSHVLDFMTMRDLGDALVRAGLAEPVLDSEIITVTYRSVSALAQDLRGTGANNHTVHRNPGLTSRDRWQRMLAAYEQQRDEQGLLPASVNVVYGHAWGQSGAPTAKKPAGEFEIPVDQLRKIRMDNP